MALREGTGAPADRRPGGGAPTVFPWRVVAILAFAACMVLYAWTWLAEGKPTGGALLLIPVALLVTAPALTRASRNETRFDLAGLMATGLLLRFLAVYYRWTHAADAHVYSKAGTQLAQSFRSLHFDVDTGAPVPGTGALRYITGLVSVPVGADEVLKFLVFTWLAFYGCVLLYRAFVTALPEADCGRYARLIFLWPALFYWPSSIGKESWMILTLGIAMLGAARVLTRQPGGYSLLVGGLLAGSFVRPHVTLLALVAFAVALLIGRRDNVATGAFTPGSVAKVAGFVVVLLLGTVLAGRTATLLDSSDRSGAGETISTALERVRVQTAEGGSSFNAPNPQRPDGYVVAIVTVLFRPFPFEAGGLEQVLAAGEGVMLAGLLVTSWRRLRTIPRRLRREPYVTLALVFFLVFVFAFASVGNFGILARERSQVMPFVFVLLSLPAIARVAKPRRSAVRPSDR